MLYFGRSSREPGLNEVFYSRFKFKCSFCFRSFYTVGVALVGWQALSVISNNVHRKQSHWIKNLQLLFDLSKERMNLNGARWLADSIEPYFISFHSLVGSKFMDYKFQVLSNIYFGTTYLIKLTHLENVYLLFALL